MKSRYSHGLTEDKNKPTTIRLRKSDREIVHEIHSLTGEGLSQMIRKALRLYVNHLRGVFNNNGHK